MNSLNFLQKQKALESLFCPPLDSALVAAILSDYDDFDTCVEVLNSLVEGANFDLDSERLHESEFSSENTSSCNYKSSSSLDEIDEIGYGSITSEEYDSESICLTNDDEIPLDEEIEQYIYDLPDDQCLSPAEFLKACFPMFSETKIKSLIQENNNDANKVSDVILNEIYLNTEQHEELIQPYASSSSSSTASSSSPPSCLTSIKDENDSSIFTESRSKHRKKERKKSKQKDVVIFQNGSSRPYSQNSSAPKVNYEYDNYSNSIPSSSKSMDYKLSHLINLFPNHEIQLLKTSLIEADGKLENSVDLLLRPEFKSTQQIQPIQHAIVPKRADLNFRDDEFQIVENKKKKKNKLGSNSVLLPTSTINPSTRFFEVSDVSSEDDEEYDPKYCRQMAQDFMKKRNEAFQKARKSNNSRHGDGGISSYYSAEGHKYDMEMKKWNLRAAKATVRRQCKVTGNDNTIDLHGLTVNEALAVVKEQLNQRYTKNNNTPLKIITGLGKHSPDGKAKLPSAINRFLVEESWDFTEHKGHVLVSGLK